MKRVGDLIEWNTKYGTSTGVVESIHLKATYIVKINRSTQYMKITEDVAPSELRPGDPNIEFMQVVKEMRDNQKIYFETKDKNALDESKRLEKKVDAIIEMCQTPDLFTENYGTEELRIDY